MIIAVKLDPLRMASGVYRTGYASLPAGAAVSFLRDGKTATISLAEQDGMVVIATNGKTDASVRMGSGAPSQDEVTTVLAAAIPLSMHPARRASPTSASAPGLTTHTLAHERQSRAARLHRDRAGDGRRARQGFGPRIHDVFTDPRSHIDFEDAKTFSPRGARPTT